MKKEYQELQIELFLLFAKDVLTYSEEVQDDIFNDKPANGGNW